MYPQEKKISFVTITRIVECSKVLWLFYTSKRVEKWRPVCIRARASNARWEYSLTSNYLPNFLKKKSSKMTKKMTYKMFEIVKEIHHQLFRRVNWPRIWPFLWGIWVTFGSFVLLNFRQFVHAVWDLQLARRKFAIAKSSMISRPPRYSLANSDKAERRWPETPKTFRIGKLDSPPL